MSLKEPICLLHLMLSTSFTMQKYCLRPGKASNAGGVATSGLEMSQNSLRISWTREEVDERLKGIMEDIHDSCIEYGKEKGWVL